MHIILLLKLYILIRNFFNNNRARAHIMLARKWLRARAGAGHFLDRKSRSRSVTALYICRWFISVTQGVFAAVINALRWINFRSDSLTSCSSDLCVCVCARYCCSRIFLQSRERQLLFTLLWRFYCNADEVAAILGHQAFSLFLGQVRYMHV